MLCLVPQNAVRAIHLQEPVVAAVLGDLELLVDRDGTLAFRASCCIWVLSPDLADAVRNPEEHALAVACDGWRSTSHTELELVAALIESAREILLDDEDSAVFAAARAAH